MLTVQEGAINWETYRHKLLLLLCLPDCRAALTTAMYPHAQANCAFKPPISLKIVVYRSPRGEWLITHRLHCESSVSLNHFSSTSYLRMWGLCIIEPDCWPPSFDIHTRARTHKHCTGNITTLTFTCSIQLIVDLTPLQQNLTTRSIYYMTQK